MTDLSLLATAALLQQALLNRAEAPPNGNQPEMTVVRWDDAIALPEPLPLWIDETVTIANSPNQGDWSSPDIRFSQERSLAKPAMAARSSEPPATSDTAGSPSTSHAMSPATATATIGADDFPTPTMLSTPGLPPINLEQLGIGELSTDALPLPEARTLIPSPATTVPTPIPLHPAIPPSLQSPPPSSPSPASALPTPPSPTISTPRPLSGAQLYAQRRAALQTGNNYTRLTADSFWESWSQVTYQPTYQEWVSLLAQEAAAMANGQGHNPLTVLLGDSISLWFPVEQLENNRFWLNQGISGDTTGGILRRLHLLDDTHPAEIHLMAGINDLRRGSSDAEVLTNLRQIMQELRSRHPQSQILVYSILPTRYANLPSDRIQSLNQQIAAIAQMEGVQYLDLTQYFADAEGKLRADLTTDGLHLNFHGYAMWDWIMGWQMVESR